MTAVPTTWVCRDRRWSVDWMMLNYSELLDIVAKVVAVAAAISAVLPPESEAGKILGGIRKIADLLGLNVGNAKNAQ